MKIALVYDYLNQLGGGERVLEVLLAMFPDAPLYTLFYDREKTNSIFEGRVKKTAFLDWPLVRRHHQAFIPLLPFAAEKLNLEDNYDLIISVGAGWSKGIGYELPTAHLHYCLSPLRYAWEEYNFSISLPVGRQAIFNFQSTSNATIFKPIVSYLRRWDYRTAQRPEVILADSQFIAQKIKNYYGREAEVIYPPVDLEKFRPDPAAEKEDYFLAVGRLLHYKKFDLIISAFNQLQLPLIIVGRGPDLKRLEGLIQSPKIKILTNVADSQLVNLYHRAQALIFPQTEDFGLVSVEAQACGTPVLAFRAGGALETVIDGVSGLFFNEQTERDLITAVLKFQNLKFEPAAVRQSVLRFSLDNFREKFYNRVHYV